MVTTERKPAKAPSDWPDRSAYTNRLAVIEACRKYVAAMSQPDDVALLCGSFSRDQGRPWSDVDLYILGPSYVRFTREQTIFEGLALQIGRLTLAEAHHRVERGLHSGDPFYVRGFAEASHVCGSLVHFDSLQGSARQALAGGPRPYPVWRVERARIALMNAYMKCLKAPDGYAEFTCAHALVTRLIEYWQLDAADWIYEERWANTLGSFPSELKRRIEDAVVGIPLQGVEPFLRIVASVLEGKNAFFWSDQGAGMLPV